MIGICAARATVFYAALSRSAAVRAIPARPAATMAAMPYAAAAVLFTFAAFAARALARFLASFALAAADMTRIGLRAPPTAGDAACPSTCLRIAAIAASIFWRQFVNLIWALPPF